MDARTQERVFITFLFVSDLARTHPVVYEYAKKVDNILFYVIKNCGEKKKVKLNAPTLSHREADPEVSISWMRRARTGAPGSGDPKVLFFDEKSHRSIL